MVADRGTEDEELATPAELLRNLRELVELDHWFGVQALPRSSETAAPPAPARDRARPTPPASKAVGTSPPVPRSEPLPDPCADIPPELVGAEGLAAVAARIEGCERCGLCAKRRHVVPGEGDPQAELMFVGEGPGADEDRQGRPFVGAAGQLLDKMITAMGLRREEVFIANIVKCRPPGNRNPEPEEVAACLPYLERQVACIQPQVICTLGNTPMRALMGRSDVGITRQRGKTFSWRGITVLPTFHPSYLLRNPAGKKPCWEDLKQVVDLLGRELPGR